MRKSILSFLPARHPPLQPGLSQTTLHRARAIEVSPVQSYYPEAEELESPLDTGIGSYYYLAREDDEEAWRQSRATTRRARQSRRQSVRPSHLPDIQTIPSTAPPTPPTHTRPDTFQLPPRPRAKRRPPPLDLDKTRAAFPNVKGVTLVRDPSLPRRDQSLPIVRGIKDMKDAEAKAGGMFKKPEFEFVSLEEEHQYPRGWAEDRVSSEKYPRAESYVEPPKPKRNKRLMVSICMDHLTVVRSRARHPSCHRYSRRRRPPTRNEEARFHPNYRL
jgi:hypothetical protein